MDGRARRWQRSSARPDWRMPTSSSRGSRRAMPRWWASGAGGERQRVALARAFLADAPILILDEATSSLDSESEALIQEAMERLIVGRTAIVIAHRLSTVRMLDRILVFEQGAVVEEGSHEELVQRTDGVYKRLFERQAMGLLPDEEDDEDAGKEEAELSA